MYDVGTKILVLIMEGFIFSYSNSLLKEFASIDSN